MGSDKIGYEIIKQMVGKEWSVVNQDHYVVKHDGYYRITKYETHQNVTRGAIGFIMIDGHIIDARNGDRREIYDLSDPKIDPNDLLLDLFP